MCRPFPIGTQSVAFLERTCSFTARNSSFQRQQRRWCGGFAHCSPVPDCSKVAPSMSKDRLRRGGLGFLPQQHHQTGDFLPDASCAIALGDTSILPALDSCLTHYKCLRGADAAADVHHYFGDHACQACREAGMTLKTGSHKTLQEMLTSRTCGVPQEFRAFRLSHVKCGASARKVKRVSRHRMLFSLRTTSGTKSVAR